MGRKVGNMGRKVGNMGRKVGNIGRKVGNIGRKVGNIGRKDENLPGLYLLLQLYNIIYTTLRTYVYLKSFTPGGGQGYLISLPKISDQKFSGGACYQIPLVNCLHCITVHLPTCETLSVQYVQHIGS